MKLANHQHDYSRIDEFILQTDIPTLTHHLNGITNELCELFQQLPLGNRKAAMEQLRCLIELNNAFKDIIVDEYREKCGKENELLSLENEAI